LHKLEDKAGLSRQYCTTTALRSQIPAVFCVFEYSIYGNGAASTIARLAAHNQRLQRAKRHHNKRAENEKRAFAFHKLSLRNRFVHLFTR